jgi:hypothetical protein
MMYHDDPFQRVFVAFATMLPCLWLGLLIGVSFLATPVKFRAASLSLAVALDVGRATFRIFSRVEWALALMLLLAVLVAGGIAWKLAIAVLLGAILVAQGAWLLPGLDARVAAVMAGSRPPPSVEHEIYAILEGVKVVLLLVLAGGGLWQP